MPVKDIAAYQLKWMKKRRRTWIKANGPCKKCGSKRLLEIKILDKKPTNGKTTNIWSRNDKAREEFLSRCEVRCRKCRLKKKTLDQRGHGSENTYKYGCRCKKCKEAKADSHYQDLTIPW